MSKPSSRLETRAVGDADWKVLVSLGDGIGARMAYASACNVLPEDVAIRLVIDHTVRAERGPLVFDGLGVA